MYNEKAKQATNKYMREKRDKLTLDFPKGDKEKYRAHAQSKGLSLNRLIINLLEDDIKSGSGDNPPNRE